MRRLQFLLCFCLIIFTAFNLAGQTKKGEKLKTGIAGSPSSARLNINNVSTPIYNNGSSDITSTGDSGFQYPIGSRKTVFFQSGPLWGGFVNGSWNVGGSAYRSGLKPGKILPDGTSESQTLPHVRIYKVRSDYRSFSNDAEKKNLFALEMLDEGKSADEIYAQYQLDWEQWPAQHGAPFIDKNNNGIYEPAIDIPGMSENPCQTIWFAANDLDEAAVYNLYGSLPLRIELQGTFWALKGYKPESNTIYRRYRLINKNDKKIDSMYFCMWSDPDLGAAFDDFCGCDTMINLGYVYNRNTKDDIYGNTPPAAGFVMLQTPFVKGSLNDEADFNFRKLKGSKNLGFTSFFMFSGGVAADWSDPSQGSYNGAKQLKNLFTGHYSRSGTRVIDYVTGKPTMFMLSGDPVNGTGWYDGLLLASSDRRFGMVSGPFEMNPGDTQEAVIAQVAAGGTGAMDNLAAVEQLKFFASAVNAKKFGNLNLAQPHSPMLTITSQNQKLVLNWWDPESVEKCERNLNDVYKFQGYNVYQLPRLNSPVSEAVKIAAYDVIDNKKIIYGWVENPVSGYNEYIVVSANTDSGIKRYYEAEQDMIGGKKPLYNYSEYYYAVTSIYVADDPQAVPRLIESPMMVTAAIPNAEGAGERFSKAKGDTLNVIHTSGSGDASVSANVIDPASGNGGHYAIRILTDSTYSIYKENNVLFSALKVKPAGNDDPVVEGVQVAVDYPMPLILRSARASKGVVPWSPYGEGPNWLNISESKGLWEGRLYSGDNWFMNGQAGKGKGSALRQRAQFHNVVIKFADTDANGNFSETDPNASFGYRFMERAEFTPANTEIAALIKNKKSYSYQEFGLNGKPNVPLAVFDAVTGKRLTVGFMETNHQTGSADGKYWPKDAPLLNFNDHETLFIYADEYSAFPSDKYTNPYRNLLTNSEFEPLPLMYFITAVRDGNRFKKENEVTITTTTPLSVTDKFEFTVPASSYNINLAKEDADKVNVFPNPYYAANPQESSLNQRFVTFTHLPSRAFIRIFNVGGQLIKEINKDDNSQTVRWNLATENNLYIASGIYVVRIDMPDLGKVKILKLAVIVEQPYPVHY